MNAFDRTRWIERDDPRLGRLIHQTMERFRGITPSLNLPRGVHKFRSIEEMNAFKDRYEDERFARLHPKK